MSGSLTTSTASIDTAFAFEDYKFLEAYINLFALSEDITLKLDFHPAGEYDPSTGEYKISLKFSASMEGTDADTIKVIEVSCLALFKFRQALQFEQLPAFFFTNSTAIVYPYIRAFISTLTAQANYNAIILPTLNISALGAELKEKTVVKK